MIASLILRFRSDEGFYTVELKWPHISMHCMAPAPTPANLVEDIRIELITYCLQSSRSPKWANPPIFVLRRCYSVDRLAFRLTTLVWWGFLGSNQACPKAADLQSTASPLMLHLHYNSVPYLSHDRYRNFYLQTQITIVIIVQPETY